eukprot:jgi/Mesen1/5767/ME000292S04847
MGPSYGRHQAWGKKAWGGSSSSVLAWSLVAALGLWLFLSPTRHASSDALASTPLDLYSPKKLGDPGLCDRRRYPSADSLLEDYVTILVNGFSEARIPLLQENMRLYSQSPVVDAIYVLWGNVSTPASLLAQEHWVSAGAPIHVIRQKTTSLNDRFLPRAFIRTKAVAICDDDITVDARTLAFALRVWRENQQRLVGFFPRAHAYQLATRTWAYTKLPDRYSIMLTKLMLLHTEYLFRYTCTTPPGVKAFVDQGMNCEDIAMNFVVTHHSGQGPQLVAGSPRDWGDTRNSDDELSSIGLSARSDHKKDRGACITAFQRLWGGLQLRYSYGKAGEDVSEQVFCDKFGFRRRYAYATLVGSADLVPAALAFAQSLRCSGAVHDAVLMVDDSSSLDLKDPILREHFDVVRRVKSVENRYGVKGFNKLNAWLLTEYAKVLYIDVDTLVLANLDHLFERPEPAAVPDVYMSGKFNSGLLVLEPSKATYADMMSKLEKLPSYNRGDQGFLNSYFSGWFQMDARHRLPARYNAVIFFPDHYHPPPWFDVNTVHEVMGPLAMVHFANPWFKPWRLISNDTTHANVWCALWLRLSAALEANSWHPLDTDKFSLHQLLPNPQDYAPPAAAAGALATGAAAAAGQQAQGKPGAGAAAAGQAVPAAAAAAVVPSPPRDYPIMPAIPLVPPTLNREIFATLIWDSNYFAAGVWAASYQQHHAFSSWRKTMLIVPTTMERKLWRPYRRLFNYIRVVEPFSVPGSKGEPLDPEFSVLHAWSFKGFDKIVYVSVLSLFTDNCNELMGYEPFAAIPSVFPPDTFSSKLLVIQPHDETFADLKARLATLRYPASSVDRFLNAYHHNWFEQSGAHRIPPSFGVDMWFKEGLMKFFLPWRILSFDRRATPWSDISDWMAHDRTKAVKLWRRTFCSLEDDLRPQLGCWTALLSSRTSHVRLTGAILARPGSEGGEHRQQQQLEATLSGVEVSTRSGAPGCIERLVGAPEPFSPINQKQSNEGVAVNEKQLDRKQGETDHVGGPPRQRRMSQ